MIPLHPSPHPTFLLIGINEVKSLSKEPFSFLMHLRFQTIYQTIISVELLKYNSQYILMNHENAVP